MLVRRIPRIQSVVIPLLRARLPESVTVSSWIADVDHRTYPIVNIRRLGGLPRHVRLLDLSTIEMTAYGAESLPDTENLLLDARQILFEAVEHQTLTDHGYLHSFFETMGPTQFDSMYDDTWRVQNIIQLGVRPRRVPKET